MKEFDKYFKSASLLDSHSHFYFIIRCIETYYYCFGSSISIESDKRLE